MPATVLVLECKSYVIVGIYASISEFPLMCSDVRFSGTPAVSGGAPRDRSGAHVSLILTVTLFGGRTLNE